jgi:drug/metabolite transporter (DMT)-like permease
MGYVKIITAILIWSSLGVFVRKSGLPDTAIIFYQSAVAGLLQLFILSLTGQFRNTARSYNGINSALLLVLLPFCFLANMLLFYFAFSHTTIANAVFTHYTAPIFVALLAPVLLKEKIFKKTWLAIILSSFGLWLILEAPASVSQWLSMDRYERNGIMAGVLSGLAYALIILVVRGIASKYTTLFIVFFQNAIVALLLLPFVLTVPLTMHSLPYVITMGIVHSTVAPFLYVQGFKTVKANEAAILGYMEPVGAIILAQFFLSEVPGDMALTGGIMIVLSGIMIIKLKSG